MSPGRNKVVLLVGLAVLISCSRVVSMRAPEQPRGCPRATAPPFTFVISCGRSKSCMTARACTANASFNSTRPISVNASRLAAVPSARLEQARSPSCGGVHPCGRGRDPGQGFQSQFPGALRTGDQQCCCAIIHARRIPGRDGPIGPESRLQASECFHVRISPWDVHLA
jgi:hypothetical protein